MPELFNALTIVFPTSKGMQRRKTTLEKCVTVPIDYLRVNASAIDLIVEGSFRARQLTRDIAKGISDTFPKATILFFDSSDEKGTRRQFDPKLITTAQDNK